MGKFTDDNAYFIMLGEDGFLRYISWVADEPYKKSKLIKEKNCEDIAISNDGNFFSILSEDQEYCQIYKYNTMESFCRLDHLNTAFLMDFTSNS